MPKYHVVGLILQEIQIDAMVEASDPTQAEYTVCNQHVGVRTHSFSIREVSMEIEHREFSLEAYKKLRDYARGMAAEGLPNAKQILQEIGEWDE